MKRIRLYGLALAFLGLLLAACASPTLVHPEAGDRWTACCKSCPEDEDCSGCYSIDPVLKCVFGIRASCYTEDDVNHCRPRTVLEDPDIKAPGR